VLIAGFPSPVMATNCWVVATAAGEQCVIVDPGIGVGSWIDDVVGEHRLHVVAVLLTHGHLDHTFSVVPVCDATDIPAYIHPADRGQLTDPWSGFGLPRGTPIGGVAALPAAEPADLRELLDGETITLAGLAFEVRHAPGHTAGSVVFDTATADERYLFSGDVLFAGSIGRVDLPGGSMAAMSTTLRKVILPMADATVVLPGHGPTTTIGEERLANPYLRDAS
jgi:hydroxyacylglutathione hydrolase